MTKEKVSLTHIAVHHLVHFRGLVPDLTAALTGLLSLPKLRQR